MKGAKTIFTYEMVAIADKNGKTYRTEDLYYSKELGFHDNKKKTWGIEPFVDCAKDSLNYFVHLDEWEETQLQYTMEELYDMIGYPFKIKQTK